MTMFWHNHFSTESTDIDNAQYVYKHHNLLRSSSLGNFKVLVKDITIDPGMLRYLNGYLNTNTAPDENYGRELQELFTLGKENNPNYTEDDVKACRRAYSPGGESRLLQFLLFMIIRNTIRTISSFLLFLVVILLLEKIALLQAMKK
jgi:hypothetical protein